MKKLEGRMLVAKYSASFTRRGLFIELADHKWRSWFSQLEQSYYFVFLLNVLDLISISNKSEARFLFFDRLDLFYGTVRIFWLKVC